MHGVLKQHVTVRSTCVDNIEELASSSLFSFPTMILGRPIIPNLFRPQLMEVVTRSVPFTNEMCSY